MTLEELFRKYADETISPEELRLLREMVNKGENRAGLNKLLAQMIEKEFPVQAPTAFDSEAMYGQLTQQWGIPVVTARPHRMSLRLMVVLSAAAASVLVFAGVFLLRHHPVAAPVVAHAPALIVPAGTKATLTLANGSRIVLDSAANGSLAQQGGTRVIKLDNGRLAYQGGVAGGAGVDGGDATLYNEISTPRGGFYELVLSDGTKVWLDVASSLRFPTAFKGKERTVELTGEAYFEIAPKADQPFFVVMNDMKVAALGTAFNVMGYQDEDAVRVTLINGSIKVGRGRDFKLAKPGEQVSWIRGGAAAGAGGGGNGGGLVVSEPDLQQVMAWKQGEFRFDGLPISVIMRQIARWYDVQVQCVGPEPSSQFSGVIPRKKDVGEILTVLEQTDEVHFTVEGRKITVESR